MPAMLVLDPDAPWFDLLVMNLKLAEEDPGEHLISCLLAVDPAVSTGSLAFHLTSRLILGSPQGEVFLRYYDYRVFPHLVREFSPMYLKSLFGPKGQIQEWTYRFQNEWITVPVPEVTEGVPLYWHIDDETHKKLEYTGLLETTLRGYRKHLARPWQSREEYEDHIGPAKAAIVLAQRCYHLSAPDDLTAFGLHALCFGANFHLLPSIHRLLHDGTLQNPGDYAYVTEGFAQDDWARITAETPLNGLT